MKLCEPILEPQSKCLTEVDVRYGAVVSTFDSVQTLDPPVHLIGLNKSVMMEQKPEQSTFFLLSMIFVWLISHDVDKTKFDPAFIFRYPLFALISGKFTRYENECLDGKTSVTSIYREISFKSTWLHLLLFPNQCYSFLNYQHKKVGHMFLSR